jgi:hypothetical protein
MRATQVSAIKFGAFTRLSFRLKPLSMFGNKLCSGFL